MRHSTFERHVRAVYQLYALNEQQQQAMPNKILLRVADDDGVCRCAKAHTPARCIESTLCMRDAKWSDLVGC
jgi:hypothetical protein